ncbi:initiation factor 2 [Hypoxylon fuscum]|nr:initiation factor 2 [Hypoxylon fuscum]
MLRARVSRRESSSICAFCRHRLSLQVATPRRRQFSSTTTQRSNDDWGSWGGRSSAQPKQEQDDFLSHHELLARKQLLAKQQAQKASQPPKPTPADHGLQARHMWNAGKQQEIERSLRRDGMVMQNEEPYLSRRDTGRSRPPSMLSRRPMPMGINSFNKGPESKPMEITRKPVPTQSDEENTTSQSASSSLNSTTNTSNTETETSSNEVGDVPKSSSFLDQLLAEAPKQLARQPPSTNNRIFPSRDSGSGPSPAPKTRWEMRSANPNIERSREPRPRDNLGNTIRSSRASEGDSDWGLLARKPDPRKSNNGDFWTVMNNSTNGSDGAQTRGSEVSRQAPRHSGTKHSWSDMEGKLLDQGDPKSENLYDWGKEFDNRPAPRRAVQSHLSSTEEDSSKPAQTTVYGTEQYGQPRGRGRDRERERRMERFEREGRRRGGGGGGGGRRPGRGSRYGNDEDEGGFDYDQYQDKRRMKAQRKAQREAERDGPVPIRLPELISITALADAMKVEPHLFLSQLGELGFEGVTLDSLMAGDTAALVAQEYGFEPTVEAGIDRDLKPRPPPEDMSILPQRPPVVTIMGHVDHGKTTLLDYLRKSSIAAQEHGGITQRIGAFSVKLSSGKPITFLDTPGHAAFLTMRQRGAHVTDIVVLVVAADDSVKPQTIEAIKHARSAKVPMIVAINKIDKDGAHVDQVKHDLAREGVEIEDFGGDVQVVSVSGKTGQGMDDLEENILTLSEILDHRSEYDGPAEGWILESSLKSIGKAATVLVKRGTLRPGDYIAAGLTWAKIRHLRNEAGADIDEAPPGTPVEILGWKDLPAAGDQVLQAPDEGRAKEAVEYREGLFEREKDAAAQEVISEARRALQEKRAREKAAAAEAGSDKTNVAAAAEAALPEEENGTRLVNFVVKGDLHGSVEAVCAAIQELGNHEVRPRILRSTTGAAHEFDVEHAATSRSVIVNFATQTPGYVKRLAEEQGVRILDHTVIYHLVDDVKATLSEYLEPEVTSKVLGEAEVLQVFPINVRGRRFKNIAGCRVRNGLVSRGSLFRVYRGGEKIYDGKLETLKHVKRDITEARKGTECGIGFEEFQDFRVGDQIQAYEEVRTKRSL